MSYLSDRLGVNADIANTGKDVISRDLSPDPSKPPPPAPEDPRLEQIKKQQMEGAKQFRANLPGYKQEQYTGLQQGARNVMSQRLAGAKADFSHRGLLYSGMRQGAEADQASQTMGELAGQRAQVSSQLDEAANQADSAAMKSELDINQNQADISRQLYDRAIAQRMNERAAFSGLASAGGVVAGAAIAKNQQTKTGSTA